ncbi:MAG TPA: ribose-phosphate diphosphokinase [Patescibacteria group bacterium]
MARENPSAPPGVQRQVVAPPGFLLQTVSHNHLAAFYSTESPTQPESQPKVQSLIQKIKEKYIYGVDNFSILAGDDGMAIAKQVGVILNKKIPGNIEPFANGEKHVVIDPEVANTKDVYIIQSVNTNPNSSLRELKHLELAAKSAGANRITTIYTLLPYARQDRIEQPGAADAARNVLQEILDAGSHNYRKRRHQSKLKADTNIIVIENHSEGPLKIVEKDSHLNWLNLDTLPILRPRIEQLIKERNLNVFIGYPDKGAAKRYDNYVTTFTPGIEPAMCNKIRDIHQNNKTRIDGMLGNVEGILGKDVLMPDDMIDTGGTTLDAAREYKNHGARSVWVVATHGILSKDALTKMNDHAIDGVIITDTVPPRPEVLAHPKIEIVPIAPLIAETIRRIEERLPLGELVKTKSKNFEASYRKWRKINKYRRRKARNI